MMDDMEYNYAKIIDDEGTVNGVAQMELGSKNEENIVNWCVDNNMILLKISKEEFDDFEGDETYEIE